MPADQRTLTLRLSATLATVKSRFQIPGASFRVAFQSTKHTASEVDIPANGTVDLPAHTKFVMVGTEDSTVQAVVASVESGDSVTFPVDQALLLPNSSAVNTIQLRNTSSTDAVNVRFLVM